MNQEYFDLIVIIILFVFFSHVVWALLAKSPLNCVAGQTFGIGRIVGAELRLLPVECFCSHCFCFVVCYRLIFSSAIFWFVFFSVVIGFLVTCCFYFLFQIFIYFLKILSRFRPLVGVNNLEFFSARFNFSFEFINLLKFFLFISFVVF